MSDQTTRVLPEKLERLNTTEQQEVPTRGLLSWLPVSWVPYAELMRLHKPVGIVNIYYPYLFGLLFAAITRGAVVPLQEILALNARLLFSCFVLRSVGCTWNDIVDAELDKLVARCRSRPMARGALSYRSAYIFTACQGIVWFATVWDLLSRNIEQAVCYTMPLIALVLFYPYTKRITHYAQVVLGFTLSYGELIGYAAIAGDLQDLRIPGLKLHGMIILFSAYVVWSIIHDMIYAFQDYKDDLAAGIMSMATQFKNKSKMFLIVLAYVQVVLLLALGMILDMHIGFYICACGGVALLEFLMLSKINLLQPSECWHWFTYGCLGFGFLVATGLSSEYVVGLVAVV